LEGKKGRKSTSHSESWEVVLRRGKRGRSGPQKKIPTKEGANLSQEERGRREEQAKLIPDLAKEEEVCPARKKSLSKKGKKEREKGKLLKATVSKRRDRGESVRLSCRGGDLLVTIGGKGDDAERGEI